MADGGPAHRVQSSVEVYGYPKGHIGHMTPDEEAALNNFKELCIEKGLYKPQSENVEFGTHDDATLLRFLRARRFQVKDAFIQFRDTEDWRNANELDTLYETIDVEHFNETRKLYPQWTGRRDRRGIPIYVYEVRHLNSKTMAAYEKSAGYTHTKAKSDGKTPPKLLRLFALYESLIRFVMPLCTAMTDREYPRTPITQSNNIVDISGVGLKQFWNLRGHMQDASTLATAHYPETLDRIFIIGAPVFFPTVWGWIKRWFDPITTSKIFILSHHEMQATLRQFIDPANIPKKYGGELDFEFGQLPVLDTALKDVVEWEGTYREFPPGPLHWHDRGDYIELEAVGSVDRKERREMICKMRKPVLDHVIDEKQNGEAVTGVTSQKSEIKPELLSLSTEKESVPLAAKVVDIPHRNGETATSETETKVAQAGEVIPAPRPELVSFVTPHDDLNKLPRKEDAQVNGTLVANEIPLELYSMAAVNLMEPKANENDIPAEDVHQHGEGAGKDVEGKDETLVPVISRKSTESHGSRGSSLTMKIKAKFRN